MYTVVAGVLVGVGSWGAYRWLEANPGWAAGGHGHGAPVGLVAQAVTRSVAVHMDDNMRFTPDNLVVSQGETIRFVIHNGGAVAHEFVLGTEQDITAHAVLMRQMASQPGAHAHEHGSGAAITVNPGGMGELVVTFAEAGPLQMACLIPGHYEAGMKGRIAVSVGPAPAPSGAPSTRPVAPHRDGHAH